MTKMSSSRSSRLVALVLATALLVGAVAGTATAIDVPETDVPEEAQAGQTITVSFTLTQLYQNPTYTEWSLAGETELENATWTIEYYDATDSRFNVTQADGSNVTVGPFQANSKVNKVVVKVTGTVPTPANFTYPEEERFLLAALNQQRGGGTSNQIGTWDAHHFTQGSQEARTALENAESAIQSAKEAGGSVGNAEDKVATATDFYELGQFDKAVTNAQDAADQAKSAEQSAKSTQQRNTLLMYGGAGLLVVLVIVGVVYWYRQQGDDYSRM